MRLLQWRARIGTLFPSPGVIALSLTDVRVLAVLALLVLSVVRSPDLLTEPRFWAEEASVHFRYAFHHPWWDSVIFVYQRTGYLHLFANVTALLATWVPMVHAPAVTTFLTLSALLVIVWHILDTPSWLSSHLGHQVIVAAFFLMAPTATGEVWLNTINFQVYLGMAAGIILLQRSGKTTGAQRIRSRALLVVGVLSGLYVAALTPLFLLKAWSTGLQHDRRNAAVLSAGSVVQALIVYFSRTSGELAETKARLPSLAEVVELPLSRQLVAAIVGPSPAETFRYTLFGEGWPSLAYVGLLLVLTVAAAGMTWFLDLDHRVPARYLLGALVLTIGLTVYGAHGEIAARYTVVPGFLFLCLLLLFARVGQRALAGPAVTLLLIAFAVGVVQFRQDPPGRYVYYDCVAECPSWADQVERWRADPAAELDVWPYPMWSFRLGASEL